MERFFTSLPLGRVLGIQVRIHVTLILLLALVAFGYAHTPDSARALGFLAILLVVLVLHELGHCVVARRFGIEVVDITLWPLGGMARMRTVPESPRVEAWLAAAGPATNFALAALALPIVFVLFVLVDAPDLVDELALAFVVVNGAMGIFNMIPMFPSDGGRILRAWLARDANWVDATRRAVVVGRVCAVILGAVGLFLGEWMLPLVAAWLWWMGALELAQVRARHERARAARDADVFAAPAPEPVVIDLAPAATEAEPPRARRFTDEDVERLERYRGRLRPDDPN